MLQSRKGGRQSCCRRMDVLRYQQAPAPSQNTTGIMPIVVHMAYVYSAFITQITSTATSSWVHKANSLSQSTLCRCCRQHGIIDGNF